MLLAEAQFQLFLVTADFVPSDITCTRPPIRDEAGELLCYALISDRVSVAAIATMESPGVYAFVPLNKVDPADLSGEPAAGGEITPEPPPAPELPDHRQSPDRSIQQSATTRRSSPASTPPSPTPRDSASVLTENNPSITSLDLVAYDAPTSTVQVAVTTNATDPGVRDEVAFFVTDVMAYLWMESEPTRDADATIHPRLEVTVDGVIYGTPFDVMVEVADYTITQDEWLEIVTGNAAFGPQSPSACPRSDGKRSTPRSRSAPAPPEPSAPHPRLLGCLDSRAMNVGDLGGLRRIAIVNRGEPAMRLIHAVRELRLATGADLSAIALHTTAERAAMFVREADEAVCLDPEGRPAGRAGQPVPRPRRRSNGRCSRPGPTRPGSAGDSSPNAPSSPSCVNGSASSSSDRRPDVMRKLGDKIAAKLLAEQADVPVAAWSGGPVDDGRRGREPHAERIGYPLMVKAAAGGGGRGIRRVDDPDAARRGVRERQVGGRQGVRRPDGVHRERRHRGAPRRGPADRRPPRHRVGARRARLQHAAAQPEGHRGVAVHRPDAAAGRRPARRRRAPGDARRIHQRRDRRVPLPAAHQQFAFLEVNTRLQVEHPVTELTTGLDLVKLQLHVAAGGRLEGSVPSTRGYAVEARLNAEDPQRGFAPAPGTIETLVLPVGPGIRVDTGVAEGDVIPSEYDSMIAKIIAFGGDRQEALARLGRALAQMVVIISGGTTNKSFLLDTARTTGGPRRRHRHRLARSGDR